MSEELERQLAVSRRQLEAVQRINAALYSVTDIEALKRLALETSLEVVDADAGSILFYDAPRNALIFQHVIGPVADTLVGTALDLSIGPGIAGQVFRTGETRITNNVARDTDHTGAVDARTGYQTLSLMTVPIRIRSGPVVGVIQVINKRTGEFDLGDASVIEIAVSLVALAIQSALLAQEAKLAAVARSIGEISHDIGNMLTQVLPYVQTLEGYIADVRDGEPGAVESLEEFYQEVLENVALGVEQVKVRTLEVARAIKGEVSPLEFELGRPFKTAQRVAHSLSGAAQRLGIALSVTGEEHLEVIYDRHRLYNALFNLVNNALPETPSGGLIILMTALDPDPDYYTVAVSDTGAGMPEEVRVKLFTDAARSTKVGGTGLGTRIVQRIVEQHGGTPSVVSAPGQGTTITLRLPKIPPSLRSGQHQSSQS